MSFDWYHHHFRHLLLRQNAEYYCLVPACSGLLAVKRVLLTLFSVIACMSLLFIVVNIYSASEILFSSALVNLFVSRIMQKNYSTSFHVFR